jgi:hypothetical protein
VRLMPAFVVLAGLVLVSSACSTGKDQPSLSDSLPTPSGAAAQRTTTPTPGPTSSPQPPPPPSSEPSPTEPPAPTGSSVSKKINKSERVAGLRGSATVTLLSVSVVTAGHPSLGVQPKSGAFTIIDLEYDGRTGQHPVGPQYVRIRSPLGQDVKWSDGNGVAGTPEPRLESGELKPKDTIRGKIAFDGPVPEGSVVVLLNSFDEIIAAWPL